MQETFIAITKTPTAVTRLGIGVIEATQEICVIYQALYGDELIWVRPLANFTSNVQTPAGEVARFQRETISLRQ